jgi:hypothetical protein
MTPEQFVSYVKGLAMSAAAQGRAVDPQQLLSAANSVQESRNYNKTQLND